MNVRNIKKTERRVEVGNWSRFKVQTYGSDNLYPNNLERITAASGTTELCIDRYARFIEGYGFTSDFLSAYKLNMQDATADDILHDVAHDLARFGGFALHVNYNVLCQIVSVSFVPFESCRLETDDDKGNVAHILVHPDWSGKRMRNGQLVRVDESNISRINVFNPDPEIVAMEIENAGGIDAYDGQILWYSKDGASTYPKPSYDAIITDISTDEALGNIKYRNARNNFLVACMLITKKGVPRFDETTGEERESEHMISDEDLLQFQGDENTAKILAVELENDEDKPEVVSFPVRNYDKEYTVTDTSVIERIYAQFHQELFYSIRIGKLGFSGQVMRDAYEYYAGEVTTEQRMIERAFKRILNNWHDEALRSQDVTLQPMKYISSEQNGSVE